jgi:hypothetical protein
MPVLAVLDRPVQSLEEKGQGRVKTCQVFVAVVVIAVRRPNAAPTAFAVLTW